MIAALHPTPPSKSHAPVTTPVLKALIVSEMTRQGHDCSLNHIDVSSITDFRSLFEKSDFNGDISGWDVRRGKSFARMFEGSAFNGDLSQWTFAHDVQNKGGIALAGFVAHTQPQARNKLRLPMLPVECGLLFMRADATMQSWLVARMSNGDVSRYHWDALLRNPQAAWATPQMREFAQTYLALTLNIGESCIEHSALCMQMWADGHQSKNQHVQAVTLPSLEDDAP